MLSAEQKELRRNYLGSSDLPAILGLDPFRSRLDVWYEKTGRVKDFDGNRATLLGNLFEEPLIRFVEIVTGATFERNVMRVHPNGLLAANFDGIGSLVGDGVLAEAKVKVAIPTERWGDEGTDDVPMRVIAQTHHQFLHAPECNRAVVPVLIPGFVLEPRLYWIRRNDQLCEQIEMRGVEFMEKHVKTDTPPDDAKASIDTLERMIRTSKKFLDAVPDEIVTRWQELREQRLAAEKVEEDAKTAVLQQLGDAEGGCCALGDVTYFEQTRAAYEVKESKFRVLRVKKRRTV